MVVGVLRRGEGLAGMFDVVLFISFSLFGVAVIAVLTYPVRLNSLLLYEKRELQK
jgi:hypothetical protein